ncbi:glycosyltransferase family 9 protein [Prevotella sp. 10(H)]|uniref:glycosyltransferase family 9 protein n=1 Tax=Prevotella sp. 10(H) TaxID=1158294 RepID=UPI000AE30AB5|nr:glycosyltransferase family 9 protein [Prevotella sp. 10(H)]
MANTLIVRYHRIGDALIVLPLIAAVAAKYPDDTFTVLTNERFVTFKDVMPSNVILKPMISKKSKGILRGLTFSLKKRLFSLKMESFISSFDKIALLQYDVIEQKMYHKVLNSKRNIQIAITDENIFMSEDRILNKCNDGITMIGLHKKTFSELGYIGINPTFNTDKIKNRNFTKLFSQLNINTEKKLIAISPFSREKTKIYPLDKIEKIISHFGNDDEYQVLIFGGGNKEKKVADRWVEKYPSLRSLIDCISFDQETTILAKCNIALTMDSANLHLAALLNIPIVSVWGATTPENGYYLINPDKDFAIIKRLDCQPCSIFGNKPCYNPKIYDCLDIEPELIIEKMKELLPPLKIDLREA